MDAVAAIRHLGAIATTTDLRAIGISPYALTGAVRRREITRVRRGWYTTLGRGDPRVIAVRFGGVLTGVSALEQMGAWLLHRSSPIHVAVPAHSSRQPPRSPRVVLHWEDATAVGDIAIASLRDALIRVALDEPPEVSVPCFDWAFATGLLDHFTFEEVLLGLPPRVRSIRKLIDPRSQSVLESVARVRLLLSGWAVRSQQSVGMLASIDLVVENHIALELDGRTFHESTFETDRRKDLVITIEGRHSLRVSKSMLVECWPDVERAISAALAARRGGDAGFSGELIELRRAKLRVRGAPGQIT